MNIIPFRGILPNLNQIPDQALFFESVKEDYNSFCQQGYFLPSGNLAFYIFRIQGTGGQATGLICTTHVQDYIAGKILKHEKTIHNKEQLQIDLLLERNAAVKPVLLVHRHEAGIHRWLQEYTLRHQPILQADFPDGESHLLWEVRQKSAMQEIQQQFHEKIAAVAIADGHHRLSSFATLWQQNPSPARASFSSVLAAYFPENELKIGAFHRLVELSPAFDQQRFWQQLQALGSLKKMESPQLPSRKHQMGIVLSNRYYLFDWDPKFFNLNTSQQPILDVDLLDQHILGPLLSIRNVQIDSRLHYIEGVETPNQLQQALARLPAGIAFTLYPIHPDDFLKIAKLGVLLSPKATFFMPRLKNGLVVQPIP